MWRKSQVQPYPWMIKHEYSGCNACHADPSGGGLLTLYGRAQSETLLRMQYGRSPEAEPGKEAQFLFGAVRLPNEFLAGGDVRSSRTDTNQSQQHGVALAYDGDGIRGEVMAVAGNFQVRPDAYRDRGYSAFAEWSPTSSLEFGVIA